MKWKGVIYSKKCNCCGELFFRGKTESFKIWDNRIFCSIKCYHFNFSNETRLKHILSKTISTESGCMEWQGYINKWGYGRTCFQKKVVLIHRLVWMLQKGDIPEGFCVLHTCDNPKCINPDHLFLGTNNDNQKDKISKGRQAKGMMFPFAKLSELDKKIIFDLVKEGVVYSKIAKEFNINRATICRMALKNGITRRINCG